MALAVNTSSEVRFKRMKRKNLIILNVCGYNKNEHRIGAFWILLALSSSPYTIIIPKREKLLWSARRQEWHHREMCWKTIKIEETMSVIVNNFLKSHPITRTLNSIYFMMISKRWIRKNISFSYYKSLFYFFFLGSWVWNSSRAAAAAAEVVVRATTTEKPKLHTLHAWVKS